jgi:hypothetical protein
VIELIIIINYLCISNLSQVLFCYKICWPFYNFFTNKRRFLKTNLRGSFIWLLVRFGSIELSKFKDMQKFKLLKDYWIKINAIYSFLIRSQSCCAIYIIHILRCLCCVLCLIASCLMLF